MTPSRASKTAGRLTWAPALLGLILLGLAPAAALADPCKAIPDKGPTPPFLRAGATFAGRVVYVGDGGSLCVDIGPTIQTSNNSWVEVRVADFHAPELNAPGGRRAKATLERLAMDKFAWCTAQHRSHDRVVAKCRIDGVSIGELMRGAGVREAGRSRTR